MLDPLMSSEALKSATYVDNYIDSVENLPDQIQRHLSRIHDIDIQYRTLMRDVDHYYELFKSIDNEDESMVPRRTRAMNRVHQCLRQAQELGDEKMHLVNQMQELIDCKQRQLVINQQNLDIKEDIHQQRDHMQHISQDDISLGSKMSRHSPTLRGSGSSGGRSTPNSDRSGLNNCGTMNMGACSGNNGTGTASSANMSGNDSQRSGSKRSRRRNETLSHSNMELVNESNSPNDGGISNERNSSQKNSMLTSGSGKKNSGSNSGAAGTSAGSVSSGNNTGKKKKRKARGNQSSAAAREETPPPDSIDPDEPTYCICNQISYGEMILCDNDLCPIEWFHFSCVSLVLKPKGRWFCPNCRGERPNIMKPKAQFLKELVRYNKEKEEKT